MRVAEVDGHVQRGADPFVQGEFRSLVPGQAVAQEFGQVLHLVDDGLLDVFGVVPVGQVQQDREPGGALDERADGAFVAAAGDEIALPVARDRPVLDLRGSLRDHGHGFAETGFAALAALGSAGGSPLPHGAFQLLLEFAPGLQVDGLVDRLDARVHIPIIREVQPQPVGYLLRAPMPAQPGGDLVPQSRALGRLARFGAFEPVRGLLLGAVRLVTAGLGIPVALDLAADRAGVAAQQAGDGADRIAQTQTVRDLDALLLAQVARMEGLGFVHGGTIPVHQGFLVPSRGARPAVAPRLAGAFRDADRVRGLGEVHAFLVQQAHVLGASRLAHQLPRRIFDAVERPTVFPATVFVSVASGHLTLLAVGQVLQRSLEPAVLDSLRRGWSPELIEGRLKAQYAGDPSMRISHECLCQWIYAKPQRALDLRQYLARGRKRRTRKKGRKAKGPRIPMRVPIADRPEAVGSRKGFGHFESDTVVGAAPSRRCMNTQVERRSRRLFARLVDDKSASATARAEYEIFKDIPPAARVDRTWDNGTEASLHMLVDEALGMLTYFADPYSSWQRGSNENRNGRIRRYLPKGTGFEDLAQEDLDAIVGEINDTPMKLLGYKTPNEVWDEEIAKLQSKAASPNTSVALTN